MQILQSITLDFGRSTLPITVFAKQYDKESRYIKITPLNSGQSYALESGVTARLQLTKADGHQHFTIFEPKQREIVATRIKDRQFQRSLCDNGLYEQITKSFIADNCACLQGRGVDYTLDRMTAHLRRYYNEHGTEGWVLKCDIHHYFPSIRHDIAKAAIRKRVKDAQIAERACEIVDSFGEIGIGLGSQVSQLVALAVLDDLDHYIKERLRIKHYVRYMDDFVLIHHDKEYLQKCRAEISEQLPSHASPYWVEFGTNPHIIKPRNAKIMYYKESFGTVVHHPGKKAQHLLRDTIQNNIDEIRAAQEQYLDEISRVMDIADIKIKDTEEEEND